MISSALDVNVLLITELKRLKKLKEVDVGALRYLITVESDTPPQILLGQNVGGAIVTELKQEKLELVSASELALKYNLSVDTIRRKLVTINLGTDGKHMYNPIQADLLLKDRPKKIGRNRKN